MDTLEASRKEKGLTRPGAAGIFYSKPNLKAQTKILILFSWENLVKFSVYVIYVAPPLHRLFLIKH
jgi:hypothetical protein